MARDGEPTFFSGFAMLTPVHAGITAVGRIAFRVGIRLPMVLFLTSLLVCLAPGFDSDERQIDARLSTESIESLRQSRAEDRNPLQAYVRFLRGAFHGDFGYSSTFNRPVSELLSERYPATFRAVGIGALTGWAAAALLASCVTLFPSVALRGSTTSLAGLLLCVPSALLGFVAIVVQSSVAAAMSCVVFSRVFLQINTLFDKASAQPHVMAAEAMGLRRGALFRWHIVGASRPQMIAIAASSISIALGAAVPLEVICDSPGLGQLAWKATLGRDLSVLLSVTLMIAAINSVAAATTDIANKALREQAS